MDYMKAEQLRDNVIGFYPVYVDGGNSTRILLDSGVEVVDRRGIGSVRQALLRSYGLDPSAQRN
ncbi:MAG: hypothetical protein ABFD18_19565, partial [Syntrophomonas sp.]